MQITFSTAGLAEITDLVRLNGMIQNQHVRWSPELFRADWRQAELQTFWRDCLNDLNNTVIVAKDNDLVIGYVWFEMQLRPQDALRLSRRRLYIHHIGVDPRNRRSGIGCHLLKKVEETAYRLNITDVPVDTWTQNCRAQSFFSDNGYESINVMRRKDLSRP